MKKIRAYTLMEVLIVMSIMIILLGLGFSAYASFMETTKFNQDVADLESDILLMQRASMLLERDPEEYWVYGIGIDFDGIVGDVEDRTGAYSFFKWCSEFIDFGDVKTKSQYPADNPNVEDDGSIPPYNPDDEISTCSSTEMLLPLSGYPEITLNLGEDVSIVAGETQVPRYLLFESVSGRAFIYDEEGDRIDGDIIIQFDKNYGQCKEMIIENLTGRTNIKECSS